MARIHPLFCFRRQLPLKQKEMSCYRFQQRDCTCTWSNIIVWASHCWSPWKQWQKRSGYHVHTQKRSGYETSVFERSTFGSVFEKLRIGARAFSKSCAYVRIPVTVSIYPGPKSSVFEKIRVSVHVASVSDKTNFQNTFVMLPNAKADISRECNV